MTEEELRIHEEEEFNTGPLSVLQQSVKNHTQILISCRNNRKLLARVKAFDRHCNMVLENVKEVTNSTYNSFVTERERDNRRALWMCKRNGSASFCWCRYDPTYTYDRLLTSPLLLFTTPYLLDVDRGTKEQQGKEGKARQQGAFHQQIVLAWRLCHPWYAMFYFCFYY